MFKEVYPQGTLDEFYNYWTEPNKSQTKMRFELQNTWDLDRRLKRWSNNGIQESNNKKQFKKTKTGLNIAFCPKCGKRSFPDSKQLKFESSCCGLEWASEKPELV